MPRYSKTLASQVLHHGHLQARTGDGCPSSHGQWYCFDDVNVEPWDINSLDKDCFGGKYTLNPQHYKGAQQVTLLLTEASEVLLQMSRTDASCASFVFV